MKLFDLGATFVAVLLFSAAFGSMTFEQGQDNPEANNVLETVAKPSPYADETFAVDETGY